MSDLSINKPDISNLKNRINNLRFYRRTFPEQDEYVLAKIINYEETGIYCNLLEYKHEALLSFKDASSSKRLRNIKKQVLKNRNYILMVTAVDNEKGFIDVEKRTIDNEEQETFSKLISFYEKIFNIFVKIVCLKNQDIEDSEIYDFLDNTLWKQDPKLIMENFENIHISDKDVMENYNLDNNLGKEIIEQIKAVVKKPVYKHTIKLNVRSLNIDANKHIKDTLLLISNLFDDVQFKIFNPPIYMCEITTIYKQGYNPDKFSEELRTKIESFIESNKDRELSLQIEQLTYKVV